MFSKILICALIFGYVSARSFNNSASKFNIGDILGNYRNKSSESGSSFNIQELLGNFQNQGKDSINEQGETQDQSNDAGLKGSEPSLDNQELVDSSPNKSSGSGSSFNFQALLGSSQNQSSGSESSFNVQEFLANFQGQAGETSEAGGSKFNWQSMFSNRTSKN